MATDPVKGKDGHYHVSRWPPGWRSDRRRIPAILSLQGDQWHIIDSNGQTWPVTSHAEVLAVAAHPYPEETSKPTKLDVFVTKLPHYPWLEEAMASDKTTAYARGRHRIGGLICRSGRLKIRIEEAAAWGAEEADSMFLRTLSDLYDLMGVGAYPTPGGLGMSLMETCYLDTGYKRESRPSGALRSALIAHRIGGRSDWTDSQETYAQVWEADQRNAYLSAAALPLPIGSVTRFLEGEVRVEGRSDSRSASRNGLDRRGVSGSRDAPADAGRSARLEGISQKPYKTWYGRCICFNTRRQANSPILERLPSRRLTPFVRQGYREFWLFKEEAEAFARREGCYVEVLEGWGWIRTEPVLKSWAEKMHTARAEASKISPELERMVKLTIVAAIGRHGCRPERRSVIPINQAVEGDQVLTDTLDGEWAQHTTSDWDAPWVTHWHAYIEMSIRLMNYQLQIEETRRQNIVLASNVDAVYFLTKPAVAHEPDILGGWRIRDKHHVRFPFVRGLLSDEKVSLPGLSQGSPIRKELQERV